MSIPSALRLRKIQNNVPHGIGTYKIVPDAPGVLVTTPLINLTDKALDPSELITFKLVGNAAANMTNAIVGNIPSPGIHVIRTESTNLLTSRALFPILIDQGIHVNMLTLDTNPSNITITDHTGYMNVIPYTISNDDHDNIFDATQLENIVTCIPPRILYSGPSNEISELADIDIDRCFYGAHNNKNAVYIPFISGTTINYPNKENYLQGYFAVPELLSDQNNVSMVLNEGDFIYMATVDASDYQPGVFPDTLAFDIAKAAPAVNGSEVRWVAVVFQNHTGFDIDSPILVKLYYVTDTTATCVNFYRQTNVDYFDYANGAVVTSYVDETYIMDAELIDPRVYLPSLFSRSLAVPLRLSLYSGNVTALNSYEVEIRYFNNTLYLYIPAFLSNLDFRELKDCAVYQITDDVWDDLLECTHVNVYYEPYGGSMATAGVQDYRALSIRITDHGAKIALFINGIETDLTSSTTAVATGVMQAKLHDVVNLSGSDFTTILREFATNNHSLRHYYPVSTPRAIIAQDNGMVQAGVDVSDNLDNVVMLPPNRIVGTTGTKSVYIQRNYSIHSDEHPYWAMGLSSEQTDEVNLYFEIMMTQPIPLVWTDEHNYEFTIITSDNEIFNVHTLTHPIGLVTVKVSPRASTVELYLSGNLVATEPLTNLPMKSELVNIKLSNVADKVRVSMAIANTAVYTNLTAYSWTDHMYLHSNASDLKSGAPTVALSNLAFYPKGTAITTNTYLKLDHIDPSDTPRNDRVSWYKSDNAAGSVDADFVSKITLLVPKFYLNDNPFSDGLFTIEVPDNDNNDDLFSLIFSGSRFIYLATLAPAATPASLGNFVTQIGQTTPVLARYEGDNNVPVVLVGKAKYGTNVVSREVTTQAPVLYAGNSDGTYNDAQFITASELPVNTYAISPILTAVILNSANDVPTVINPYEMYLYAAAGDLWMVMSAGLLMQDEYNIHTVTYKIQGVHPDLLALTHWLVVPKPTSLSQIPSAIPANLIPPPDGLGIGLLIATPYTFNYEIRVSKADNANFKWGTKLPNNLDVDLPRLGKTKSYQLINTNIASYQDDTLDDPRLLHLTPYNELSDVPSTILANQVVVTREPGVGIVLLLAKSWSDLGTSTDIIKLIVPEDNHIVHKSIINALILSKYIIVDPTVSDGSLTHVSIGTDHTEVFVLSRNQFSSDVTHSEGFSLTYVYKETGMPIIESFPVSHVSVGGTFTASVTPSEVALPKATYMPIVAYPHGVVKFGDVTGGLLDPDYGYITEVVDHEEHTINLIVPAKAFFYHKASENFIGIEFKLMDADTSSNAATGNGFCITPDMTAATGTTIFRTGNLIVQVPRSGTLNVFYFNGDVWNDMLDVKITGYFNTQNINAQPLAITNCNTLIAVDDVYHKPMILKKNYNPLNNEILGNEIHTHLGDSKTFITIPSTWVSLDPNDSATVTLEASNDASVAIHNASVVVVYSGTRFGTIGQLPTDGTNRQAVILSRYENGFLLYHLINGVAVHQELLVATSNGTMVSTNPVVPDTTLNYIGGFVNLTKRVGVVATVVRTIATLHEQHANEISYVEQSGVFWLFIPTFLLSGNMSDLGIVKILVTEPGLRAALASEPNVCLFNGPIDSAILSLDSSNRVYIGTESLASVTVIYNGVGLPYSTLYDVPLVPTGLTLPIETDISFMPCDDNIGCTMLMQPSFLLETEIVNMAGAISGSNDQRFTVTGDSLLLHSHISNSNRPVNLAVNLPLFSDITGVSCYEVNFRRHPRGEVSLSQPGLPTSTSSFSVTLLGIDASHVTHTGTNKYVATSSPAITVHFGRYLGTPITISDAESGRIYITDQVEQLPQLSGVPANPRNVIDGHHDIRISFVKTNIGAYLFVYNNLDLIAYTRETVNWFIPKSVNYHLHSNMTMNASEYITDMKYLTRQIGLSCLPLPIDGDLDCGNKFPNTSASRGVALTRDNKDLITGLKSYSDYGYYHITLSNPTTIPARVTIYVTATSTPDNGDITPLSPYDIDPGQVVEIPLITLQNDEKLFVECTAEGIICRTFSMENYVDPTT